MLVNRGMSSCTNAF